jgi:hypothetical protein
MLLLLGRFSGIPFHLFHLSKRGDDGFFAEATHARSPGAQPQIRLADCGDIGGSRRPSRPPLQARALAGSCLIAAKERSAARRSRIRNCPQIRRIELKKHFFYDWKWQNRAAAATAPRAESSIFNPQFQRASALNLLDSPAARLEYQGLLK